MNSDIDYYAILDIPQDATQAQVREAYRLQTHAWHPDRFPEGPLRTAANARMAAINSAFEILGNRAARSEYDRLRREAAKQRHEAQPEDTAQSEAQSSSQPNDAVANSLSQSLRRRGPSLVLWFVFALLLFRSLATVDITSAIWCFVVFGLALWSTLGVSKLTRRGLAVKTAGCMYMAPTVLGCFGALLGVCAIIYFLLAAQDIQRADTARENAHQIAVQANNAATVAESNKALLDLWSNGKGKAVSVAQVQSLLNGGADVDAVDESGESALMDAAYSGNLECLKLLIANHANVNARDSVGLTPLMQAAVYGNADCIKPLALAGADLNASENHGLTALMESTATSNPACLSTLIAMGANVNKADKSGRTVLMYASAAGNVNYVSRILDAGAVVNTHDNDGSTALAYAAIAKVNRAIISKLLKHAATNVESDDPGVDIGTVTSPTALYANPNASSSRVRALENSSRVTLVGRRPTDGWLQVIDLQSGHQGWVPANYLQIAYTKKPRHKIAMSTESTGGTGQPTIGVANDSDSVMYLHISGMPEITITSHHSQSVSVPAGVYSFNASAPNVLPDFGDMDFVSGDTYTWTFTIYSSAARSTPKNADPALKAEAARLQNEAEAQKASLAELRSNLDAAESSISEQTTKYKADRADTDTQRSSLDHSDSAAVDAFNKAIDAVNAELDAINQSKARYRSDLDDYNAKIAMYNKTKQRQEDVSDRINARK